MAPTPGDKVNVVRIFMGTRADMAPKATPQPVYIWDCDCCHAKTFSVAKPLPDHRHVCNVCASQITAMAEQDPNTHTAWNMTDELEDGVREIAEEKGHPVDEVFNRFLEWKLGRPMKANLYSKPEQKKAKE